MPVSLSRLFNISLMPFNRRIQALHTVRECASSRELDDIVEAIDRAIAHDEHALSQETARLQSRSGASVDTTALDGRIDKTLGLISDLLEHYGKDTNASVVDKANRLNQILFPQGLEHHIHLPYAEQHEANAHVVTVLEDPEHREWIDTQGLRSLANRLRRLNASFGALLHNTDDRQPVSLEEMRTERKQGHELLLEVVARIVGRFPSAEDGDTRGELLQPILEQESAVLTSRNKRQDPPSHEP